MSADAAHGGTARGWGGLNERNCRACSNYSRAASRCQYSTRTFFEIFLGPRSHRQTLEKPHERTRPAASGRGHPVVFVVAVGALARGVGVARARALVPQPAAFGAAAEPEADDEQADNCGKARGHHESVAHYRRGRERRCTPWPAAACRRKSGSRNAARLPPGRATVNGSPAPGKAEWRGGC